MQRSLTVDISWGIVRYMNDMESIARKNHELAMITEDRVILDVLKNLMIEDGLSIQGALMELSDAMVEAYQLTIENIPNDYMYGERAERAYRRFEARMSRLTNAYNSLHMLIE